MTDYIHLNVRIDEINSRIRRTTTLHGGSLAETISVFHEGKEISPMRETDPLDAHILPVLLFLMSRGHPVKVHGTLSRTMMRNLDELQLIWSRWKPLQYSKIIIDPDAVSDFDRSIGDSTISAFSGGVDSTFTALRHAISAPDSIRYKLSDVLMVHGFDVSLSEPGYFDQMLDRVSPFLQELKLRLRTIQTNSKSLNLQNWEDSFALQLAGCLHMFSGQFRYGLIGSSEPYEALVLPWGSSPVTDHLMTGSLMEIVHDGAGFSRTEKVALIASHSSACGILKVCWEGTVQSTNCGTCEKCIRTKLNFLASGNSFPSSLPGSLYIGQIGKMRITSVAQLAELKGISDYAVARGIDAPWLHAVQKRISLGLSRRPFFVHFSSKLLRLVGLESVAQRIVRALRTLGRGPR